MKKRTLSDYLDSEIKDDEENVIAKIAVDALDKLNKLSGDARYKLNELGKYLESFPPCKHYKIFSKLLELTESNGTKQAR